MNKRILTLPGPLPQQVEMLWRQQTDEWPRLNDGLQALTQAQTRSFKVGMSRVVAQCNPARVASASAKIDSESLAKRPCFLCEANLPQPQKAVVYKNDWFILCNPAPLVEPHFTIAASEHLPQRVDSSLETMLEMVRDLDGKFTLFYNGPKSGASAPDHLHLQVSPAGTMPFEMELVEELAGWHRDRGNCWIEWHRRGSTKVGMTRPSHRPAVVLMGDSDQAMLDAIREIITVLGEIHPAEPEPMLNMFITFADDRWIAWIFPRAAHRPKFYGTDPDQFLISPGAVDLNGIMIVPRPQDLERLDTTTIQHIYNEVLFSPGTFAQLRACLTG